MLKTIYLFELKKLFFSRVNMIAMAGVVVIVVFLATASDTQDQPASRESAKELDGRSVDELLFEELKPALKDVNGLTILQLKEGYEKYAPVLQMIRPVSGDEFDFSHFQSIGFYELRRQRILQRMEKQGLSDAEMAYWDAKEADVRKPFPYHYHSGPANLLRSFQALGFFILLLSAVGLSGVYARETADRMNQLLLCSRHGKKKLYLIKFAAGITWILTAAVLVILALLIPYSLIYGMEGTGEMLQLVKPLSMLPYTIGQMLAVCLGIYLLAAVLIAAVTMLLSVITQNALAVTCGLLGYLIVDLFAVVPDRFPLLQMIWSFRPNEILRNTGFVNYRLIHFAGRFFMNWQAAPVIYTSIAASAFVMAGWCYRRLQVGN
ncbi:MAG: hypothetical protein IJJ25_03110 [Lachnospiraceae bacterium]|nr:hypothetical protein [Lachnospiraceae bacterium]